MARSIIPFFSLLAALVLSSCGQNSYESNKGPQGVFDPGPAPTALLDPQVEETRAPDEFRVRFVVADKGSFEIDVTRSWSPRGADRFYNLVRLGYFDHAPFFRVVDGFVVQFGISAWPEVNRVWSGKKIPDDTEAKANHQTKSNKRGTLSFAKSGKNSRSTELFINLGNNGPSLDAQDFTPFGVVAEGMDVVDSIYKGYGEMKMKDTDPGVDTMRLRSEGLAYVRDNYALMDVIESAEIVAD